MTTELGNLNLDVVTGQVLEGVSNGSLASLSTALSDGLDVTAVEAALTGYNLTEAATNLLEVAASAAEPLKTSLTSAADAFNNMSATNYVTMTVTPKFDVIGTAMMHLRNQAGLG